MNAKTCKQCGELKPLSQYRRYYGNRKGYYTSCKQCESINSRYKYLKAKHASNGGVGYSFSLEELKEMTAIEELYKAQRLAGLSPPKEGKQANSTLNIADYAVMTEKYTKQIDKLQEALNGVSIDAVPPELQDWLVKELTEEPEYYLDEVYEDLCDRYKPQISIDPETLLPVYDLTHHAVLTTILERFDNYDEQYYK